MMRDTAKAFKDHTDSSLSSRCTNTAVAFLRLYTRYVRYFRRSAVYSMYHRPVLY